MNKTKDENHGAVAGQVDCHVRPWDVPVGGLGLPIQERVAAWANGLIDKAVAVERERCAQICRDHAADKSPPFKDYEDNYLSGWLDAANECGWAIEGPNVELTGLRREDLK